jgi:alkaline phosphatase D
MLDDRAFRSAEYRVTGTHQMLGTEQIEWAIDRLKAAETRFSTKKKGIPTFKIVVLGGQWLSNNPQNDESYANTAFKAELDYFLKRLAEEKIGGVILLSGDLHRGEMNRIERPGLYPLTDITTSSLTAGTNLRNDPPWSTLVPGTIIPHHNFALLKFSGPADNRILTVKMMGPKGELWNAAPGSTTEVDPKWIFAAKDLQADAKNANPPLKP